MRFAASSLEQRKKRIRGILASFDRDEIPSNYKADIFASIGEEQSKRSSSEWVIGDDLPGSLMQKGCHDPAAWVVLNELEPADVRMRKFGQKINRLFKAEIEKYDNTVPWQEGKAQRRALVEEISQTTRILSQSASDDLEDVSEGLNDLAQALVSALQEVCKRNMDSVHKHGSTRTRRSSGGEVEISLYHYLIHSPPPQEPVFILAALEAIKALAPGTFKGNEMRNKLRGIVGQLLANGTPKPYRDRL
ncbi:uncharacterized protein A1O9_12529, partial [Exophiala aquamarina CBS 119918]